MGPGCQLNVDNDDELRVTKVWINCVVQQGDDVLGVIGTGIDLSTFIRTVVDSDQTRPFRKPVRRTRTAPSRRPRDARPHRVPQHNPPGRRPHDRLPHARREDDRAELAGDDGSRQERETACLGRPSCRSMDAIAWWRRLSRPPRAGTM